MGTFYSGNRSFYTEGDRLFNGPDKRVEYDRVTLDPIAQKQEEPEEKIAEKFVCDICGKEAESNAGLAAHKRFKHTEKIGADVFKIENEG